MTEDDVGAIADAFLEKEGVRAKRVAIRPPLRGHWTVLYQVSVPGLPNAVVDGPTVVLVDEDSGTASFFEDLLV